MRPGGEQKQHLVALFSHSKVANNIKSFDKYIMPLWAFKSPHKKNYASLLCVLILYLTFWGCIGTLDDLSELARSLHTLMHWADPCKH